MPFKLSICIPTYNREQYLKVTLDSVVSQLNDPSVKDRVEICISDNASEDNTKELVESYKKTHSHITYFRWDKNMGADNNYLKIVEIARGEYCWLLSSDDILLNDSLKTILAYLDNGAQYDVLYMNYIVYDITMTSFRKNTCKNKDIIYTDGLKCAREMATEFGYLSAITVKKSRWDKYAGEKKFIGTAFSHVYIILSILKNEGTLIRIAKPLLGFRLGNDSFLSERGHYKRLYLNVAGFAEIADDVFGKNSPESKAVNKTILRRHVPNNIMIAILNDKADLEYRFKVFKLCFKYYGSDIFLWIKILPLLTVPAFVLQFMRFVYGKTLKKYRMVRN